MNEWMGNIIVIVTFIVITITWLSSFCLTHIWSHYRSSSSASSSSSSTSSWASSFSSSPFWSLFPLNEWVNQGGKNGWKGRRWQKLAAVIFWQKPQPSVASKNWEKRFRALIGIYKLWGGFCSEKRSDKFLLTYCSWTQNNITTILDRSQSLF